MNRREFLASGATGALLAGAGCLDGIEVETGSRTLDAGGSWPRPGFDAGASGHNPDVTGPTEEPSVRWEADVPVDSGHHPAIAVADGVAFFAGGSTVTALDIEDGTQRWRTDVADEYVLGGGWGEHRSVAVGEERVYVGTHEGLTALSQSGDELWSHDVAEDVPRRAQGANGVFRSPAVFDGAVYFCTVDYAAEEWFVHAYATDGEREWSYELDERVVGGPAVTEGGVFVAETGGDLYALSHGGERRWSKDVRATSANGGATPTVFDGTVYVAGAAASDWTLHAFDARTGEERWQNGLGPQFNSDFAILGHDDPVLVCPTATGSVFGYGTWNGETLWGAAYADISGASDTIPATTGESVYLTGEDSVVRTVPYEGVQWEVPLDDVGGSTVAVLDGALLVGSEGGVCYALA